MYRHLSISGYRSLGNVEMRIGLITVLLGSSEIGKSNIVRAIRDLFYGSRGSGFFSYGKNNTTTAVTIDNFIIVAEKVKKVNDVETTYKVLDAKTGKQLQVFHPGSNCVPEQISDIAKIHAIEVDDVEIRPNVMEQSEPWFLLSRPTWTGPKIGRIMGKATGIDDLFVANKHCSAEVIKRKKAIKAKEESLSEVKSELQKLEWVSTYELMLNEAKAIGSVLIKNNSTIAKAVILGRKITVRKLKLEALAVEQKKWIEALEAGKKINLKDTTKISRGQILLKKFNAKTEELKQLRLNKQKLIAQRDELQKTLMQSIQSKELTCPLCGLSAHKECREAMKEKYAKNHSIQ